MSVEEHNYNTIVRPVLENLEQRLMLTTLYAGDFFIYQNSQGDVIRVDLVDYTDSSVRAELIANHRDVFVAGHPTFEGGYGDVVGILYKANGDVEYIGWGDGFSTVFTFDADGNRGWKGGPAVETIKINPGTPLEEDVTSTNWGSWTEIYAIYIPNATPNTQLLVTTLSDDGMDPRALWTVDGFSGTTPFLQGYNPRNGQFDEPGADNIHAPAGTGGALVGGMHAPYSPEEGDPTAETMGHYWAPAYDFGRYLDYGIGVFPGGYIEGGITVESGDMGHILVMGTVAGNVYVPGSLERSYIGFLWGTMEVYGSMDTLLLKSGGLAEEGKRPMDASIYVAGQIRLIDATSGDLAVNILVDNAYWASSPSWDPTFVLEWEVIGDEEWLDEQQTVSGWLFGYWVDHTNDTMATAQYVSSPTGFATIWGRSEQAMTGTGTGTGRGSVDYYAFSVMGGQTITINGCVGHYDITMGDTFNGFVGWDVYGFTVRLVDMHGNVIDTLGKHTTSGASPTAFDEQKPIVFTAPEAGIYYIEVSDDGRIRPPLTYTLFLSGLTGTALGAIHVAGMYGQAVDEETNTVEVTGISVRNGGSVGVIDVGETLRGGSIYVKGGGELGVLRANVITAGYLETDSNVGRLHTEGNMNMNVIVGMTMFNDNAYIQNIYCGGIFGTMRIGSPNILATTGSIGIMEVVGDIVATNIIVNSDGVGPGGRIDLIDVGGNWGGANDPPTLSTGPNGNIGAIRVVGDIYERGMDGWLRVVPYTIYDDGRTVVLNDDGGGQLRVTGLRSPVLGPNGQPVRDANGMWQFFTTTVAFRYIKVDGGVGGVIVDLQVNGPVSMVADGVVHVSHLLITGENPTISVSGSGECSFYYVSAAAFVQSFTNTTPGALVSGRFGGGVDRIAVNGSIGAQAGSTGAWISGYEFAPGSGMGTGTPAAINVAAEVRFGWFANRINGLNIIGDVNVISAGGSIGDLRIEGSVNQIIANSDKRTTPGGWDGIAGVVWARGRIGSISVGDGVADTGGGELARAGIFSTAGIGTVSISGPRYESGGKVFGEIRGVIIGSGAGIDRVVGTNGATLTGWVLGTALDTFTNLGWMMTSPIGTVNFSGQGAFIYQTTISGTIVGSVITSRDSRGIWNVYISGDYPPGANVLSIGRIEAGGDGLIDCFIYGGSGRIGPIVGVGPVADIRNTTFESPDGIVSLTARDFSGNFFSTPGKIDSINATGMFIGNTSTLMGGLGKLTVGRDFRNNYIAVAGTVDTVSIKGQFMNSALVIQGADGHLKNVTIGGDMDENSLLLSAGRIGKIVVSGQVRGDIVTTSGGKAGDIETLQVDGGYVGNLTVGGSLGTFTTKTSLGLDPSLYGYTQTFNIWGNVGMIRVQSGGKDPVTKQNIPADLFANINVGGNVKTIQVDGTLYGDISVNGDLENLQLAGGLGGMLDIGGTPTPFGSVHALGSLKNLKFNTAQDMVADLFLGGSLKSLEMKGGSILGNIEMPSGTIGTLSVSGGDIAGNVTVRSVEKISVTGTQDKTTGMIVGGNIFGDLTVTGGNVKNITLKNGSLLGDVSVLNGDLEQLNIEMGSLIGSVLVSGTLKKVEISGGDLLAPVEAGGTIGTVSVKSKKVNNVVIGGNIAALINGVYGVGNVQVEGNLSSTIRSGVSINQVTAGSMSAGAIVSAAYNIGTVNVKGNMINAMVLAGYDVGPDGVFDTGDDNPLTGGAVHAGTIKSVTVNGLFFNSTVAAGVNPDDLANPAKGVSRIEKMKINDKLNTNLGASAVLAHTSIDASFLKFLTDKSIAGVTASIVTYADPAVGGLPEFGQNSTSKQQTYPLIGTIDGLSFKLTGAGKAYYDSVNHTLILWDTTSSSQLTITGDNGVNELTIISRDNAALGSLTAGANVNIERIEIDGLVGKLTLASGVTDTLYLPGGLNEGRLLSLAPTSTFGAVGTLAVANGTAADLLVDTVKNLTVGGMRLDLGKGQLVNDGNVFSTMFFETDVLFGGIEKLDVKGLLNSANVFRGEVKTVTALGGGVNAMLTLLVGTLDKINSNANTKFGFTGDWAGVVDIHKGLLKNASFAGAVGGEIHAAGGIGKISATGDMTGVIATRGDVDNISTKGTLRGRIGAAGSGKTVDVGAMDGALVSFGGNLDTVKVARDMVDSMILAGFDAGSAGYQPGDSFWNAAQLDSRSTSPGNADRPSSGSIKQVTVGGRMERSSIGAGVSPGNDGFLGSNDDMVFGMGTIGRVQVKGYITGSLNPAEHYGIVAASNLPQVTMYNQPFTGLGNMVVQWVSGMAGPLQVVDISVRYNSVTIYFNHPLDMSTFDSSSLHVLMANNSSFIGATDMMSLSHTISYDNSRYAVTISMGTQWSNYGEWMQVTVDDTVRDNRNNRLDGEFRGAFPSGDSKAGGDFVFTYFMGDLPGDFYYTIPTIQPVLDGGPLVFSSTFAYSGDVSILHFSADAWTFFSANLVANSSAYLSMALFYYDADGFGYHKLLTRVEASDMPGQSLFAAFELPVAGDYYLAICMPSGFASTMYTLSMTHASSDTELVNAQLNGVLPRGARIAYVSNELNENNNELGYNDPKQLVYINFTGGVATKFLDSHGFDAVPVGAFNLREIDPTLANLESQIINGGVVNGVGITGIMEYLLEIYQTVPASVLGMGWNVQQIVTAFDWDAYESATNGLFFTTINPATKGYDSETEYTTIFVGNANTMLFGGSLLGIACQVDLANMEKADNAIVFSQMYAGFATASTVAGRLQQYSFALANCIAHELGHTLGLNHQPTVGYYYTLMPDLYGGDLWADMFDMGALMAYRPMYDDMSSLSYLGTAYAEHFRGMYGYVGYVDTLTQLTWWLT
ncbi:MAG: YdgA family protein [Phycisphaerae bacterium]|nr:YdgA family protein [Phycisphaerae bacterium]